MAQKDLEESVDFNPIGLLGGIAFPGLGHVLSGRAQRGVLAGIGVLGLFGGGLLTAGLTAVDSQQEFWWFVPQAGVGPLAFGVDWIHQNKFKVVLEGGRPGATRSADPDEGIDPVTRRARPLAAGERPPKVVALGKPAELGLLMCALGGMMNFIVVVDAGFPTRRPRQSVAAKPAPAGAAS